MPKCPKCNAEINVLVYRYEAEIKEDLFLTEAGEPEYGDIEVSQPQEMQGTDSYSCPECDGLIATDLQEALEFLTEKTSKLPS